MQSYLIRRLLPFFVTTWILEIITTLILAIWNHADLDFDFLSIIKTFGVLLLTTSVSFLFMMIPYVIYITFLPTAKTGSKADQIITLGIYGIFVFINYFEEVSSLIFWEEFQSAFNFIAVDYLVYTHEVIGNITQSYPIYWIIGAITLASVLTTWIGRKYLIPALPAPKFGLRLFHGLIYGLVCILAYTNVDMSNLEVNQNRYNNEIAKEGTYSLFSAFLKNELPYKDFYLTQDPEENLALLQQHYAGNNVTFVEPKKNISRQINSFRPEKRANVIIVLMESMSSKFLDENRQNWERKVTPNLSRLSKESLYFSNTYATGTRSVRGIEALNLSIPPLPGQSLVRRPGNENLHGLGEIFKEKGYDNKWIYGGYGYFDNMNYFMEHNGFQVIDRTVWEKDEINFANAWGASDEDTFNKIIKEADKSYAEDKPFLTFVLTISNHRPYTYPEGRIDLPSKTSGRDGGIKFADYAIGKFIEDAKTKPWFDNTLFVFVADHTAGAAGDEEIDIEGHHIPLLIYGPKLVKAQRIDTPISQIDVLPTVLGLLDFSYESRFYGRDALAADYKSRFFVSNYQKIGYVKNGVNIVLKPVRQYTAYPENAASSIVEQNLKEAIAYYQSADDWITFLKE